MIVGKNQFMSDDKIKVLRIQTKINFKANLIELTFIPPEILGNLWFSNDLLVDNSLWTT